MIFPYVHYRLDPTSIIPTSEVYRPEIRIKVFGPRRSLTISAIVDTGADHVFLSAPVATAIGADLTGDSESALAAGGHETDVWPGSVEIEIRQSNEFYRWPVTIAFLGGNDDPPIAYLGQAGFLEYFTANFGGERQTVELFPNKLLPQK
jgi:hypothetical protein